MARYSAQILPSYRMGIYFGFYSSLSIRSPQFDVNVFEYQILIVLTIVFFRFVRIAFLYIIGKKEGLKVLYYW